MTAWSYTRAYTPEAQESRDKTIAWCEEQVEEACRYVLHYGTRDEFLVWVGEIYDRTLDSYNDWLSTQ